MNYEEYQKLKAFGHKTPSMWHVVLVMCGSAFASLLLYGAGVAFVLYVGVKVLRYLGVL